MVNNFKNLLQLQRYFTSEKVCVEYLEAQLWNGIPVCPHCGSGNPYRTVTRSHKAELKGTFDYRCRNKECFKKFAAITGTIFENTKIELKTWFAAIYIATAHKKGISSLQLGRDLGITQRSAWFVLHRIREMLKVELPDMLTGTVEADETYIGGKNINRHENKKHVGDTKIPVIGILDRKAGVRTFVLSNTDINVVQGLLLANMDKKAELITDKHPNYLGLKKLGFENHTIIKKNRHTYITDEHFHTNSVEGYWSLLKRGLYGIYHQVSPKHLQRYCDEFAARYNSRKIKDNERFELTVKNSEGRLKYNDLIQRSATYTTPPVTRPS